MEKGNAINFAMHMNSRITELNYLKFFSVAILLLLSHAYSL